MPKKLIQERIQQLQDMVAQLVNSLQRNELGQEEFQQQNNELQALLAELSQQTGQEHQEHEHRINALYEGQSLTERIKEIEQRRAQTANELQQTNEAYQALLDRQSKQMDRLSKISEKHINALKENGFFTKRMVNPQQETSNNAQEAQPGQPAATH
ncbi:hypothetical protein ACD661_08415 [Legionella lytica]|uniref:Uncharacterized protein n=1 Tax=Legionella lytica TaxID=96232 RepID=A0ABW8D794_9GAMM